MFSLTYILARLGQEIIMQIEIPEILMQDNCSELVISSCLSFLILAIYVRN